MTPTSLQSRSPVALAEHEPVSTHQRVLATENIPEEAPAEGDDTVLQDQDSPGGSRRKGTGGLRISQAQAYQEDMSEHQRRMALDNRTFPKRRKVVSEKLVFQPSTLESCVCATAG